MSSSMVSRFSTKAGNWIGRILVITILISFMIGLISLTGCASASSRSSRVFLFSHLIHPRGLKPAEKEKIGEQEFQLQKAELEAEVEENERLRTWSILKDEEYGFGLRPGLKILTVRF